MKHSGYRRYRRSSSRESGLVKKDNRQDQQFFGETIQERFFKPVAVTPQAVGIQRKSSESDKEEEVVVERPKTPSPPKKEKKEKK